MMGSGEWGPLLSSHQGHLGAHLPFTVSPTETSRALLCSRQGAVSWAIQGELFFQPRATEKGGRDHSDKYHGVKKHLGSGLRLPVSDS